MVRRRRQLECANLWVNLGVEDKVRLQLVANNFYMIYEAMLLVK